jgi:hypothetical protein
MINTIKNTVKILMIKYESNSTRIRDCYYHAITVKTAGFKPVMASHEDIC